MRVVLWQLHNTNFPESVKRYQFIKFVKYTTKITSKWINHWKRKPKEQK